LFVSVILSFSIYLGGAKALMPNRPFLHIPLLNAIDCHKINRFSIDRGENLHTDIFADHGVNSRKITVFGEIAVLRRPIYCDLVIY